MGRPFLWPVVGLVKQEPAPELLACAFVRSVGPALSFLASLGATKVALTPSSSWRCDQLFSGTTELLAGFNGQLLVGRPRAGSREHSGPGAGLLFRERRLAGILACTCLELLVAGLGGQHECGPGRRTTQ
jgi:hypothetical protein